MKKRFEKTTMGIILIALAGLLIASQIGYDLLPDKLSGIRLLYLCGSVLLLVNGFLNLNIWTIGFGGALGYWAIQSAMHWPFISVWVLALTVVLVCSGLEMIFHKKKRVHVHVSGEDWEQVKKEGVFEDGEHAYSRGEDSCKDAVFSSVTRYVQDRDFRGGEMDVVFSTVHLYFDQAKLHENRAVLSMDVVFSHVIIYVPREWDVVDNMSHIMCGRRGGDSLGQGEQTLVLEGDCVFGGVKVERV